MTVAEDGSTPAIVRSAAASTVTTLATASFSPPANSLIFVAANLMYTTQQTVSFPTVTCAATGGLGSLTNLYNDPDTVGGWAHSTAFYIPVSSAPGSITVTMTRSSGPTCNLQLAVRVLTGAASPPITLLEQHLTTTGSTTTEGSVTPHNVGSQLYISALIDERSVLTAIGNTTALDNWDDTVHRGTTTVGMSTALTSTTSATTYGFSNDNVTAGTNMWTLISEVPPATAPTTSPPTGLTATAVSSSEIDLSWTAPAVGPTPAGYDIERDGNLIAFAVAGTTYNDTGLTPGVTYTYNVRSAY